MSEFLGKGSNRRPIQITREEDDLRWALALGKITFDQFEEKYNVLLKQGKIKRSGRIISND